MSRLSLRLRLTLAFAAATALVLAATGIFLYLRLASTLDEQIDQGLRARADDVAALAAGGGGLAEAADPLAEADESLAQVLGPDGHVRDAAPPGLTRPLLTRGELARARRGPIIVQRDTLPGLDDAGARLLARRVPGTEGRTVVVVGASLDDREEALAGLLTELLVGGPIALALVSLLGYALAAAALAPVETMRGRAELISASTPGSRLPVPPSGDELARLAGTLNDMLERLEAGLRRERRFVAEASHELRTPLALLRAELELALRRPREPDELRRALVSAAEEADRLSRLADDLLVLARTSGGALPVAADEVGVDELLGTIASRFRGRAAAAGRALEVEPDPALTVVGDRLRLEQALGNLVDNALRHGDGPVRLTARAGGGTVELHVTDAGAGIDPEVLPVAFEPFSRGNGARSTSGAGLGLAIVDAVARAHGGSAHAGVSDRGGADVWLAVPTARSATRSRDGTGPQPHESRGAPAPRS